MPQIPARAAKVANDCVQAFILNAVFLNVLGGRITGWRLIYADTGADPVALIVMTAASISGVIHQEYGANHGAEKLGNTFGKLVATRIRENCGIKRFSTYLV